MILFHLWEDATPHIVQLGPHIFTREEAVWSSLKESWKEFKWIQALAEGAVSDIIMVL